VPRARPLLVLLLHALALWALSALALAVAVRVLSLERALVVHAIAAPILTALVMAFYFGAFGGIPPIPAALLVAAVVALADLAASPWLRRATTPFQVALETWTPWTLVFAQALASGIVARRRPRAVAAARDGEVTAGAAPSPERAPVDRAVAADLPAIRALVLAAGRPAVDVGRAGQVFLVARREGAVIGCVGLEPYGEAALLRSLVVAPEHRGEGHSLALYEAAIAEARSLGIRELFLLTTTAAPLFDRWGFRTVLRDAAPEAVRASPEFAALCPASATCMGREVGS
jgi:amino-acid N-acetyltransferase